MVAIILEENNHTRLVLTKMLSVLGYESVLSSSHIDEVCFYISQNLNRVKLILSASSVDDGPDFPLSRLVIQNRELDLTPMVYIQNESHFYSQARHPNPLSRIDDTLTKPFIVKDLKASIVRAHQRRAALRNTILILGNQLHRENAIEAMYDSQDSTHWKEVLSADTFESFKAAVLKGGFRVGSILIAPEFLSHQLVAWLRLFRRSPHGIETPIAFLSQDPGLAHEIRPHCDLFVSDPKTVALKMGMWRQLLLNLSRRLLHGWQLRDLLATAKDKIKSGDVGSAKKNLKQALALDSTRWEAHELEGILAEKSGKTEAAIESFKTELGLQPFAPLPYLKLIQLASVSDRDRFITSAAVYCPHHPQIQALIGQAKVSRP